jgi:hypothetical protein
MAAGQRASRGRQQAFTTSPDAPGPFAPSFIPEGEDLDPYTFETRRSQYPGVKSDIFVFDGDGRPVIQGRDFHGGPTAFWTLSAPFQQRPQLY